jgi:diguanylate cyclase (GGDEF)-like protein
MLSSWGYSVTVVEDGTAALRELESNDAPKLALLDWMMPGLEGPEVVRQIRKSRPDSYVYVLLLTARSERSDLLLGLASGADDFLTKPFDALELRARLSVGERIIDLQNRLAGALMASEFRASHDTLTGVYNRGMIMNLLEREKSRCVREGAPLTVFLADVDHFKSVNDTYGHSAGDQVLLEVATRIKSALRSYDILGRYGGEEFLVVTPGCGPNDAPTVADRIRQSVGETPIRVGDINLNVTISLGGAWANRTENISTLLKRADEALYEAKDAGRNTCRFRLEEETGSLPQLGIPGAPALIPPAEKRY